MLSFFPFFLLQNIFFSSLKYTVMLLIGRITKDAVASQLKDEKTVVNFSIAINDYYKPKNGEAKKFTTFVNCAYWLSSKIAPSLTKGTLVEIDGRIHVNAYLDMKGEARASLNCHVNKITLHAKGNAVAAPVVAGEPAITEPMDDLPF
jgi:single-strand DNA-binding protein